MHIKTHVCEHIHWQNRQLCHYSQVMPSTQIQWTTETVHADDFDKLMSENDLSPSQLVTGSVKYSFSTIPTLGNQHQPSTVALDDFSTARLNARHCHHVNPVVPLLQQPKSINEGFFNVVGIGLGSHQVWSAFLYFFVGHWFALC